MTRGAGGVGTVFGRTDRTTAKTPTRTTTIATTRTATNRARFSDAGGGGGLKIPPDDAGIVPGATDPDNEVPHAEQKRFANEFGVPQRGHTALADMQALQRVEQDHWQGKSSRNCSCRRLIAVGPAKTYVGSAASAAGMGGRKIVLVIFDGLGDRPLTHLGPNRPPEANPTPNLDWLGRNVVHRLADPL